MADPTYLIKLNGVDITSFLAIGGYKVSPNKLWTAADRDLGGDLHSTRIGTFPKIALGFKPMSRDDVKTIAALLDNSSITVSYWYELTQTYKNATFYAGDFDLPIMHLSLDMYEPWSVNLVPFNKVT